VATTHTDLQADLYPSVYVEKRYREKLRIETQRATEGLTPDEARDKLLEAM